MASGDERDRGEGREARWGGKNGLVIALSPEHALRARALAIYPDVRADHVTLAYGVDRESFSPEWVPGGRPVGSVVPLRGVGMCKNERVQAILVEAFGSTLRPWDGGRLHLTVSKQPDARSLESNDLVARATPEPLDIELEGVIMWDA